MKSIVKSWKTTLGGVLSAVGLILVSFDVLEESQAEELVGAITAIVGVLMTAFAARDSSVSSESAGAE